MQFQTRHPKSLFFTLTGNNNNRQGDNRIKVSIRLPQTQTRSCRAKQLYKPKDIPFYSMGFSRKRQSILVGLAKVCIALAPNMQFYFYRIDRKVMDIKWSRALASLL
jgi:hypothetical protein